MLLISPSLKPVYHLHFCHACLNLLMDDLAVAQCSSFVKHHEWIPAMYLVAIFECCSIIILMHLDGYLLFIADRCHICFACHFQTVHPIPVIFISISTEITSPFQWHTWISKWRPGSCISCHILHLASCIAYRIPHIIPCSCVGYLLCCVLLSGVCFFSIVPVFVAIVRIRSSMLGSSSWLHPFVFFMDSFFFLAGFQAR